MIFDEDIQDMESEPAYSVTRFKGEMCTPLVAEMKESTSPFCAGFMFDLNYGDGKEVEIGSSIEKTWRIENIGTDEWINCTLTRSCIENGEHFSTVCSQSLPYCPCGSWVDVKVEIQISPTAEPGPAMLSWYLIDPSGSRFDCEWLQYLYLEANLVSIR
jgi:hypothetical protein